MREIADDVKTLRTSLVIEAGMSMSALEPFQTPDRQSVDRWLSPHGNDELKAYLATLDFRDGSGSMSDAEVAYAVRSLMWGGPEMLRIGESKPNRMFETTDIPALILSGWNRENPVSMREVLFLDTTIRDFVNKYVVNVAELAYVAAVDRAMMEIAYRYAEYSNHRVRSKHDLQIHEFRSILKGTTSLAWTLMFQVRSTALLGERLDYALDETQALAATVPFHVAYPYLRAGVWDGHLIQEAVAEGIDPQMLAVMA